MARIKYQNEESLPVASDLLNKPVISIRNHHLILALAGTLCRRTHI